MVRWLKPVNRSNDFGVPNLSLSLLLTDTLVPEDHAAGESMGNTTKHLSKNSVFFRKHLVRSLSGIPPAAMGALIE